MTAANGCLVVRPGSQLASPAGLRQRAASDQQQEARQQQQEQQQPQQEQQQQDAVPLEVAAGTVVITADSVIHCSGPNHSPHWRRAWMPQFAAAPIRRRSDGACVALAVPLQPLAGEDAV